METDFQESASAGDGITSFNPNNAIDWQHTHVQVNANACTLDNQLQNNITQHWNNGGTLSIKYHTFTTSKHALTTISGLFQINRSLSRIAPVFVTFDQRVRKILSPFGNAGYTGGRREFNNFKYPGDTYSKNDSDYLELQIHAENDSFERK